MDNKAFNDLTNSINTLQKLVETNKESSAKVMLYIVNKINEIEKNITGLRVEIDALNEYISKDLKSEKIKSLENNINNINKKIDSNATNLESKTTELLNNIDKNKAKLDSLQDFVNSNIIKQKNYFIIDRSELEYKWLVKLKRKIYVLFHYKKIKKQEQEELIRNQKEIEEMINKENERKRMELKRAEEEKKRKEEEIRNILSGKTKK